MVSSDEMEPEGPSLGRREGARSLLEALVAEEGAELAGIICGMMGPAARSMREPADVLQEALAVATHAIDAAKVLSREGLRAWLLAIARNRVRELARRAWRSELVGGTPEPPAPEPVAREDLARREAASAALLALGGLPLDHRVCLMLHDMLGLPWKKVAFALRRSSPAARKLYARARSNAGRSARSAESLSRTVPQN